ncbi:MAG: HAD-IC family P-type ATPase, partial [Patescibacteria group bacterium]|nr:HAD-IC family P-type ATPase [Patescibacteria group bacterium]
AFSTYDVGDITKRYITGSSESNHAVSKAIMEYAKEKGLKPHVPDELEEIAGQGISFLHDGEKMLMGRLSFMENNHCHISDEVRKAIVEQKDIGNGIVCLAVNGTVVGVMSYRDELRPRVKDIIAETKQYGIREWHMLTGDNERTAAAVAHELGIRHFHANMTPEGKVEFIRKFEIEHSNAGNSRAKHDPKKGIVGYIGDGVNDAASLALADVSIAMGGIGADAAIEASDITIMKDHLDRVPEVVGMSKKVMNVMWGNFWIWGITNLAGLALVAVGILGPAGAATYNFLTDFIPIGNAFRARRR